MIKKYLDSLYLLRYACHTVDLLDWENDLQEQITTVFGLYKDKYDTQTVERKDLKTLENYILCINTFDKDKIYKKNIRILK